MTSRRALVWKFAFSALLIWTSVHGARAQSKVPSNPQPSGNSRSQPQSWLRGQVVLEGALVYEEPNFDAKIIGSLKEGARFRISRQIFGGAFYRVQVQKGRFGFVADTEIRPLDNKGLPLPLKPQGAAPQDSATKSSAATTGAERPKAKNQQRVSSQRSRPKVPFTLGQFGGLAYYQVQYRESTMGDHRSTNLGMFGLKLTGADLVVSGLVVTELNLNFSLSPPDYYERATQRPASGHLMLADFQFVTQAARGPDLMTFYGFGPLLRWSKYNLQLDLGGGNVQSYRAEDLSLGAVFSLGGAFRAGPVAVRAEVRYHWELMQYLGFGVAVQGAF